jgi:hypothetical protein
MKKYLLAAAFLLCFIGVSYSDEIPTGRVINLTPPDNPYIVVRGTSGSSFSNSFPLEKSTVHGLRVLFFSPGVVNVRIEPEYGFVRPAVEGTTDATNYAIGDSSTPVFTVTNKVVHIFPFTNIAAPFCRLKFTGLTGNNYGTTVTMTSVYIPRE